MISKRATWLAPLLAVGLAGCVSAAPTFNDTPGVATNAPTDFNAVPVPEGGVAAGELPPPEDAEVFGPAVPPDVAGPASPVEDAADGGEADQVAALPPANGQEVTFDDLLGAWTISIDGGGTCQLFLTGTPWEDGFRGSTRDCQSDALSGLSSWRLEGQQVILAAGGSVIGRLQVVNIFRDGGVVANALFEGQLVAGGVPVSFFR